jgi:hypothetical protein
MFLFQFLRDEKQSLQDRLEFLTFFIAKRCAIKDILQPSLTILVRQISDRKLNNLGGKEKFQIEKG